MAKERLARWLSVCLLLAGLVSVAATAPARAATGAVKRAAAVTYAPPSNAGEPLNERFRGVNWERSGDNFTTGDLLQDGLTPSDSYSTVYMKATQILTSLKSNLNINTVRLGLNEPTAADPWWTNYGAVVRAATDLGMNVVLAFWSPSNSSPGSVVPCTDGTFTGCYPVSDYAPWWAMWQKVIDTYASYGNVYVMPFNEAAGYSDTTTGYQGPSATQLADLDAAWLAHYPDFPRGRVILGGSGDDYYLTLGHDHRLDGTLLSYHPYCSFGLNFPTEAAWTQWIKGQIAGMESRTVISEFGLGQGTTNFDGPRDGNNCVSYVYAVTDYVRARNLGLIYWDYGSTDSWSVATRTGSGTADSPYVTHIRNQSFVDRLEWGYGLSLPLAPAISSGKVSYTYDDTDPALQYSGSWTHAANQGFTSGDYMNTESYSGQAGDSMTVNFNGTAVRWIGSQTSNHGLADVYLDGTKQATVDCSGGQNQAVLFSKSGLTNGPHTLKIVVDGTHSSGSTDNFVSIDAIDVPAGTAASNPTYPVVPQQPGTAITLNGRDSHIIVANYKLGDSQLQYSTSEIMTNATIGNRDVAVLYGDQGSDGETVLRYASQPTVQSAGGAVTTNWDPATGDLRLNYTHNGLTRVSISGGGSRPLMLLLGDKATAETFWQQDTAAGPVLVRGSHLLRTAASSADGSTVALTGDNGTDPGIEVFTSASAVTWNGKAMQTQPTSSGSLTGQIPTAAAVQLPGLTNWKHQQESPEAQPGFDDSSWQVADKMTTNSVSGVNTLPVLYADDYGFHTGNTWYRGRFRASGSETGIHLVSDSGGGAQAFSAWLNGTFLGSSTTGSANFTFPAGSVKANGDNIISVLTVNMGHEEDYNSTNGNKTARGLTTASLTGAPLTSVTWRLQGARGGENMIDPVRGPLSTGGLFGERAGWSLPGYPDGNWAPVTLPATDTTPGVSWYRTNVALDLPKGNDTSLGLTISDDPSRQYRALIYVNGWQVGDYVNYRGPQHSFPVPNGILNPNGSNSIAIAVWNLDGSTGGLGKVSLTNYGSYTSPLMVAQNDSPRYDPQKYAMPKPPGTNVDLQVPDSVSSGQTFTAKATVSVPADAANVTGLTSSLKLPSGWTAGPASPASVSAVHPGSSATFTWQVQAASGQLPSASAVTATANYTQSATPASNSDERIIKSVPPPPPPGTDAVSDLPFLSATNGWGPVERDMSNGEQAAGDGHTITINGVTYAKGLGTNSISDVEIYLGGHCSQFTAQVGVDDETNGAGTVTFSVAADGKTLVTTPTIRGHQPATPISVNVSGAQVLDLIVGDAGDGNGYDHGDWAIPTLTCS